MREPTLTKDRLSLRAEHCRHVRFVPKADMSRLNSITSSAIESTPDAWREPALFLFAQSTLTLCPDCNCS
jgi:hypothetical protein